jgi:hypothetical protein
MQKMIHICLTTVLCFSTALPLNRIIAAEKAVTKASFSDVTLGSGNSFHGRFVNSQGEAVEGASVRLLQNNKVVAETSTTKSGEFEVSNLKPGNYTVQAGQKSALVRMWDKEIAPPAAKEQVVMISDGNLVRGQLGGLDLTTTTVITLTALAAGFSIANYVETKNNSDDINDIKKQLASP